MNVKISSVNVHYFLRAAILTGFAVYIAYVLISGEILQFIVPQLVIYVKLADAALFITAGFQFYIAFLSLKQQAIPCSCGHDHQESNDSQELAFGHHHAHGMDGSLWKNIVIYGLFIIPLVLGSCLPNKATASSLVDKKGMNLGGYAVRSIQTSGELVELGGNEDPALKQLFKANVYDRDYARLGMMLYKQQSIEMKDEWFIEKLHALNSFADNFRNKEILIKGFVYREAGLPGNQFIVGRMGMTHCIADISPYGIIAEASDSNALANDSWVTITGKIGKTVYNGQPVIKLIVEKVQPAAEPSVPYVYPDWNFASKL
ncbi:TIGR03943 family putative permease subunit [Paenibacillus radicis (ex Xue et al. 2023)]|uniref:TIGR03943 family protein n=1 Tax=Paenibacillus radicis (ex Xue et al. 2023) TaxID=2972489 RepID=A0ABT1YDH5_9BACL|nr:TIGR03943 family protein [Paenibacillus radicis (ex Xue et al. 2023)]MCR8631232.1 TIGR03943 family protein [Paenibacillus radicis (ex Xue et al. 2023)]